MNTAIDNDEKILYAGGVVIDTLQIAKRLRENGLTQSAAEGLSEVFSEFAAKDLATKNDLLALQNDLKQTELALRNDIKELRDDLKQTELRFQHDLKQTELRLQHDLKETELRLQKEIQKTKANIIMWVAGFFITQTLLLFTLVRFVPQVA